MENNKKTDDEKKSTSKISTDDHRSPSSSKGKTAPGNLSGKGRKKNEHSSKNTGNARHEDADNTNQAADID